MRLIKRILCIIAIIALLFTLVINYGQVKAEEEKYTATLVHNNGTGQKSFIPGFRFGQEWRIERPEVYCFSAPDGKIFDCYLIDGEMVRAGTTYTITKDIEVIAQWRDPEPKDIFIDNTIDNSKSYISAKLKVTNGENVEEIVVYEAVESVTFSMPMTDAVSAKIEEARTKLIEKAKEYMPSFNEDEIINKTSTGRVWDNRRYEANYEDEYTRVLTASGDYGKETYYTMEASVTPSASVTKGDLDKNGVVDANDASVALELYKAQNATAGDIAIGDMDENNLIDANDASLILEYYKTHQ